MQRALLYTLLCFLFSCSFYKTGKMGGNNIYPRNGLFIKYEWRCSEEVEKGPFMTFGKGFRNDTLQLYIADTLYYTTILKTNKSNNISEEVNFIAIPYNNIISIRINSGKLNHIKINEKYCFIYVDKRIFIRFVESKRSKRLTM